MYYNNGVFNCAIKFESNVMNWRRKVFNINGKLELEDEYIKGIKYGKIKEYYLNGDLKLEGNYINGKKHGIFKEHFNNGIKIRMWIFKW